MKESYFIFVALTSLSCQQLTIADQERKQNTVTATTEQTENGPDKNTQSCGSLELQKVFQLSDAERILGENAQLKDSSLTIKDNVSIYQCAYTANAEDEKTGKTGAVYCMVECYKEIASARQVYASIKTANQAHGIKNLDDIGDEAYFHSDKRNFLMIMARKDHKVLRMKVNKMTSHTSVDEFNIIVKNIVVIL